MVEELWEITGVDIVDYFVVPPNGVEMAEFVVATGVEIVDFFYLTALLTSAFNLS